MSHRDRLPHVIVFPAIVIALAGCSRLSWGPDGMRFATGSRAAGPPPFEVAENLILRPADRAPAVMDRGLFQRRLSAAIDDGVLPSSGERAVNAWLLVGQSGNVLEVRIEEGSGDPAFDGVFSLGIRESRFRPAFRSRLDGTGGEAVTVWLHYPYRIGWRGRSVGTSTGLFWPSPHLPRILGPCLIPPNA